MIRYIESAFMGYGRSLSDNIGIILKSSTLMRWALSFHICSQMMKDVSEMKNERRQISVTVHNEYMPASKQSNAADRVKLGERLAISIYPLTADDHTDQLQIAPAAVNVDRV